MRDILLAIILCVLVLLGYLLAGRLERFFRNYDKFEDDDPPSGGRK